MKEIKREKVREEVLIHGVYAKILISLVFHAKKNKEQFKHDYDDEMLEWVSERVEMYLKKNGQWQQRRRRRQRRR